MTQLVPVDHDPFAPSGNATPVANSANLVPVEHDPFQPQQGLDERLASMGMPPRNAPAAGQQTDPIIDAVMGVGRAARQGGIGLSEGTLNVLGLPVDAVNAAPMLANILPGVSGVGPVSPDPVMGSDWLKRLFTIDQAPEPQGVAERMTRRVGQEIGAASVPVAGAAGKAAQVGVQGARELGPIARSFVEPAAVAPARTAAREAAAATAAGTGAGLTHEVPGASQDRNSTGYQISDLIGALGGVGAYGVATGVTPKIWEVVKALRGTKGYTDDVVRDEVTRLIAESSNAPKVRIGSDMLTDTDPLVAAIQNGRRVSDTVPGFQESLADRTRDPGIAALEYSRQSGPNSGQFRARTEENTAAIDTAMNRSEPQGTPGMLRSELELERDRRLTDASTTRLNAEDAVAQAVQGLQPQGTPAARGNTVRTALEDAREAARTRTEEAYGAADINDRPIDPRQLVETIDNTVNGLTQVERSFVPEGLVNRIRVLAQTGEEGVDPVARMKEATDLRSELQKLQRAALGDPRAEKGGRNAARVLGQLSENVDNFVMRNISPEKQEALRTARGTKFEEAEAFTRRGDPVAAALARNEGGMFRMRDERVAASFTDPQNMDRLFAQADTPEVRQAIRDEVLSRAQFDRPENIQRFTQDYGEQLNRFPGLREQIEQAAGATTARAQADTNLQTILRDLGDEAQGVQGRSVVGRYLRYGDENAEKAMRGVLNSAKPGEAADELLRFVNDDPSAVEGARKVFWDIMQKDTRSRGETTGGISGNQPWLPKRLQRFIDDPRHAAVAERLYRDNPEHWQNVKTITEAIQGIDVRNTARAANTSGTAQSVSSVLTPETLQSRILAWHRGQISGSFLATSILAVGARRAVRSAQQKAISDMLDKALLNPDAAVELLKKNNPANRAALRRKAKSWLGNEASTFVNMMDEDEDPVKDAVRRK